MVEIWKEIPFAKGLYEVSNLGRVRSINRGILCQHDNGTGRLIVRLSIPNKKPKNYKVHRLVAIAFVPNPKNYPEINHKDENPKNNCASNLEWCTRKYNINYSSKIKINAHKVGLSRRKPIEHFEDGKWVRYAYITEAEIKFGLPHGDIRRKINRGSKEWRDINKED